MEPTAGAEGQQDTQGNGAEEETAPFRRDETQARGPSGRLRLGRQPGTALGLLVCSTLTTAIFDAIATPATVYVGLSWGMRNPFPWYHTRSSDRRIVNCLSTVNAAARPVSSPPPAQFVPGSDKGGVVVPQALNTNTKKLSRGHIFFCFFSPPPGCKVMIIERRKRAISERAYLAEKNIEVLVKLKQVWFESVFSDTRKACLRSI